MCNYASLTIFLETVAGDCMKASKTIAAGLLLGASFGMSACTTVQGPSHVVSARAVAQDCLSYTEGAQAPKVMMYDSNTHVETHVTDTRSGQVMTMQEHGTDRVTAVGVDDVGRSGVPICEANGRDLVLTSSHVVGPNPVIVGAVAGAVVGAAVTKNGKGATQGAVVGATLGSMLEPSDANAVTVGAAAGAVLGAATGNTNTAATGAVAGAVLGLSAKNSGYYDGHHDGHDDKH